MDIFEAVRCNDDKELKRLVEVDSIPLTNISNADGQTAAHIAAKTGNLPILKYLLDKDASLLSIKDARGRTLLHLATRKGAFGIVEYLIIDRKMDVHEKVRREYGNSVLHIAAQNGHLSLVKYFIEKHHFEVNTRNDVGEPPLFLAADNVHLNVIKYLVDEQNADMTAVDNNLDNILFVAAKNGDVRVPKFILDEKKVALDLNQRDYLGDTILHRAAWYDNVDFIRYMVEEKNADVDYVDTYNRTPLYRAVFRGHLATVQYLAEHGTNLEIADTLGHKAVDVSRDDEITAFLKRMMSKRVRRSITGLSQCVTQSERQFYPLPYKLVGERGLLPRHGQSGGASTSRSDIELPSIGNFLLFANTYVHYVFGKTNYKGSGYRFPLSVKEILANKVDQVILDVVNA